MNSNDHSFSIIDYILFIFVLIASALIGFYYAWKERHKKTTNSFLLGNRKLKMFPVGMSIMASFTSAVSILGFSREMYQYGSMYFLMGFSYFLTQPFAAHVYVPFFHRLKLTSAYEYLELRFNVVVRVLASLIFCLQMFFYMAVVLYSPSLALNQVMGVSLWLSVCATGIICTVYTALGGMKAVVFTDTFQVFVMFIGLFVIIIQGVLKVGGIEIVWKRAYNTGRLELFDFNPDPFQRHTFWSLTIGAFFTSLTVYGSNQATIQRYLCLPTIKDAIWAMYMNLIGTFSILAATCICGFVAFAYYFNCDPLLDKKITKYDQILPYLVMDLLNDLPGLAGLFIACIYSAALSTISSGLNSLSAVSIRDFIQPFYRYRNNIDLTDSTSTLISKILAAVFGLLIVSLSYLCQYLGATVLQISLSIFGILGGPLLGVISLGMFVPYANSYGATIGLIISLIVNLWLGIGSVLYGKMPQSKPFNQFCNETQILNEDFMQTNITLKTVYPQSSIGFIKIYQLSYLWFSLTAILNVFIFGILFTFITNLMKVTRKEISSNLTIDICKNVKSFFTKKTSEYSVVKANHNAATESSILRVDV